MNDNIIDQNKSSDVDTLFPSLPIEEWEETKHTLHLFFQIVGKIRLTLFPKMNHWWHVTLYLSPRGMTTRPIPYGNIIFEIEFDFIDHTIIIRTSNGQEKSFGLEGISVSDFYKQITSALNELGIEAHIKATPYDVPFGKVPFESDQEHSSYDKEYVNRYWRILVQVNSVFEEFRSRFIGKSTPVHLYWHHADLAVTRYSGKKAPDYEGGTAADKEAYSHEVISVGFWAGDENVRAPAFYSYTYPEPKGLAQEPLAPKEAFWNTEGAGSMAILMYDDLRKTQSPRQALLDYLESAYQAGAKCAKWEIEELELKIAK
ncbi:MAG: DUF5996 family protein [Candidatus Dadabacteria bacterium]|jgi:hypothetical protein|nr:DUF5996 family protein [Candidatus Dadabacteria bacterium]MCZ6864561.1 DUF5996 family protein [Candidatus Dadabacteria bacterium]